MPDQPMTRRKAVSLLTTAGVAAASPLLVPQTVPPSGNLAAKKKIRPEDIRSGSFFGQYQLRGSLVVLKDNLNAKSGYIAFGTDASTVPTAANAGTGVYIDYTGVYGLASGAPQFYIRASDGKAAFAAGDIIADVDGLHFQASGVNNLDWKSGVTLVGSINYGLGTGGTNSGTDAYHYVYAKDSTYKAASYQLELRNNGNSRNIKFRLEVDRQAATQSYGAVFGTGMSGLMVGAGSAPAAMLESWADIGMKDGITAPSATAGVAKIYVDTADGDLKVVFGDGTVKTLATDT